MSSINRADLHQDVYRPRGGSLQQWAHLRTGEIDRDPYGEADELARIANDLANHSDVELNESE
jgi:hypothetical protein